MNEKNISIQFRVKRTQIEMMRDRGFNVDEEKHILNPEYKIDDFRDEYMEKTEELRQRQESIIDQKSKGDLLATSMSSMYTTEKRDKAIYVHYLDTEKNNKKSIPKQLEVLSNIMNIFIQSEFNIDTIIIVSQEEIKKNDMDKYLTIIPSFYIQTFLFEDLIINRSRHKYVPKHELINDEEASRYLIKHNLKPEQLPQLCYDDQIVKYYGGKPGQMFKIYRKAPLVPTTIQKTIVRKMVSRYSVTTNSS